MEARTLTLATLKSKGACAPKVALFRKMFGKSVQITEALCVEHASAFSWKWAAENLLTASAQDAYEAAWVSAQDAYEAAWVQDAYEAARASAWARAYISDAEVQP